MLLRIKKDQKVEEIEQKTALLLREVATRDGAWNSDRLSRSASSLGNHCSTLQKHNNIPSHAVVAETNEAKDDRTSGHRKRSKSASPVRNNRHIYEIENDVNNLLQAVEVLH